MKLPKKAKSFTHLALALVTSSLIAILGLGILKTQPRLLVRWLTYGLFALSLFLIGITFYYFQHQD